MGRALYIQSVEDAASIAGGYERLADELGVSTGEIERWRSGAEIPACEVLIRLIELSLDPGAKLGHAKGALAAEPVFHEAK
jgi:hypothetical protein